MSRRMVSSTFYSTPEQFAALRALSERTRVPMAEFVRAALDLLLAHPDPTSLFAPPPAVTTLAKRRAP